MSHHESSELPPPLDWLGPALDGCHLAIERGVARRWRKGSSGAGPTTVTNLDLELDLEIEDLLVVAIHDRFPDAAVVSEKRHPDGVAVSVLECLWRQPSASALHQAAIDQALER